MAEGAPRSWAAAAGLRALPLGLHLGLHWAWEGPGLPHGWGRNAIAHMPARPPATDATPRLPLPAEHGMRSPNIFKVLGIKGLDYRGNMEAMRVRAPGWKHAAIAWWCTQLARRGGGARTVRAQPTAHKCLAVVGHAGELQEEG